MPFMIGGARGIGADFPCHLVEFMRTIVYEIPRLKVKEPKTAACFIFDESEFRASVVADPFAYLRDKGISDQFEFEDNFQVALDQACPLPAPDFETPLYLVIQFKEDMNSFAAVDGQCRSIGSNGVERYVLVECGEPYTPSPNERNRTINAVLTAVRGGFGITDGMEPCFKTSCYRTDEGQCVLLYRVTLSEPTVTVTTPIDAEEVANRACAAAALASQIENSMQASYIGAQQGCDPEFRLYLEELLEALQLDKTQDHAYWRLWYLQLCDRLVKFWNQCSPGLQLRKEESLKDEIDHRNLIAHPGVNRIDGTLLRSIQTKAIDIIKRKT